MNIIMKELELTDLKELNWKSGTFPLDWRKSRLHIKNRIENSRTRVQIVIIVVILFTILLQMID